MCHISPGGSGAIHAADRSSREGRTDVDATAGLLVVLVRGLGSLRCDLPLRPARQALITASPAQRGRRNCQATLISLLQNAAPSLIASRPFQARKVRRPPSD